MCSIRKGVNQEKERRDRQKRIQHRRGKGFPQDVRRSQVEQQPWKVDTVSSSRATVRLAYSHGRKRRVSSFGTKGRYAYCSI